MKPLVVDASVALKWVLVEPDSALAENVLFSPLVAPDWWRIEVANGGTISESPMRQGGWWRGKVTLTEDFNDLPADIAEALGENRAHVLAAMADPAVKERLKNEVDAALAKGVFGSPYIIVDGEPFWGNDRLDQVDAWLTTGGF